MNKLEVKEWAEYVKAHEADYSEWRKFNDSLWAAQKDYWDKKDQRTKEFASKPWFRRMFASNPIYEWRFFSVTDFMFKIPAPTMEGFMNWKVQQLEPPKPKRKLKSAPKESVSQLGAKDE